MADSHSELLTALRRFLVDAQGASSKGTLDRSTPVRPFAEALAALPSCAQADAAALTAAKAAGYALAERRGGKSRLAERALDADTLVRTGVAGLLRSDRDANLDAVARELVGYLAGPAIEISDYVIVDTNLTVSAPVPVVDGWELVTPSARAPEFSRYAR